MADVIHVQRDTERRDVRALVLLRSGVTVVVSVDVAEGADEQAWQLAEAEARGRAAALLDLPRNTLIATEIGGRQIRT